MRARIAQWAARVAEPRGWLLVGVVYLTATVLNSRRIWHFGPDTRFYLAWAYRYAGFSEQESGHRTYEFLTSFSWFAPFCYGACDANPAASYTWLFHGEEGGLVAPRVVYPLLSAPFVRMFGPAGMLVVPFLAYTACVVMAMVLASRFVGTRWAALAGIAVILPISITAFGQYAYTEALAMALCLACVLTLPLQRESGRRDWLLFSVFLLLFAFTRQFHPIVVAGVGAAWLATAVSERRLRNAWLPFLGLGVAVTLVVAWVQSMMGPGYSVFAWFLKESGAGTVSGIPGALPGVLRTVIVGEVFTAGRDFGLVLVTVLGVLGLCLRWRNRFTHFVAGLLMGTALVQLLNATASQNRYWAMTVPLLAVSATIFVFDTQASRAPLVRQAKPADWSAGTGDAGAHRPALTTSGGEAGTVSAPGPRAGTG